MTYPVLHVIPKNWWQAAGLRPGLEQVAGGDEIDPNQVSPDSELLRGIVIWCVMS